MLKRWWLVAVMSGGLLMPLPARALEQSDDTELAAVIGSEPVHNADCKYLEWTCPEACDNEIPCEADELQRWCRTLTHLGYYKCVTSDCTAGDCWDTVEETLCVGVVYYQYRPPVSQYGACRTANNVWTCKSDPMDHSEMRCPDNICDDDSI